MIKVKICGITNIKDALAAVNAGADALGFVFHNKSPRYISPSQAKQIVKALPLFVTPVAVVVNQSLATVLRLARLTGIQAFQLHGEESPTDCAHLKKSGLKVIKAFRVREGFDFKSTQTYKVDAYLFDAYSKYAYGGTGVVFNWKDLKGLKTRLPVILSGGLDPQNVEKAIRTVRPYAVDVSSGVEKTPGFKDHNLVRVFLKKVRSLD